LISERNELQVADFSGAASPPPGLPVFGSNKDFQNYLQFQMIEYVIFQYKGLFEKRAIQYGLTRIIISG
jgi:hypothetical protein